MAELRIRQAARALLLTPDDEVLLVRFVFPSRHVWALPGGGLESGEDHVTALRRELIEEVGLADVEIGPHVWTREHTITFLDGRWDGQREQIHLVRTSRFDPRPSISWDELRAEHVHEIRWWTLAEIQSESAVVFAPRNLPTVLGDLVARGEPAVPIDTGV
ncbi:MAG: NUDIX domain-containing protein [Ilumatobacter sp.]|nr:NUDIX domain-containing protein [Ilumatobacter sp.]